MEGYRYVDSTWAYKPTKPVIDDEPIYEGIPKGLHNPNEGIWQACDVRRYAYWSVFAGSCGHTYGHNAIVLLTYLGQYDNKILKYRPQKTGDGIEDGVLIAIDASKNYLS